jgi:glutaredoxin 3
MARHKTVTIYTKQADPYSVRAMTLLRMKGVSFTEKQLPEHEAEMKAKTGTTTVPQILIGDEHIGSFDALGSLELQGKLDELLRAQHF